MDIAYPHRGIWPTLDGDVFVVLCSTTRGLTGREVARLAKRGSPSGVLKVLERLVEHGFVHRTEAGRAFLYTFNRDHLAASAIEQLTDLRGLLISRLRTALARWDPAPVSAVLFGSAARGDGGTDSDIDVLLVSPTGMTTDAWRVRVERLTKDVYRWTGNHAAILEVEEGQLRRLVRERVLIASELRRDAVQLAGVPITSLLDSRR